MRVVLDGKRSDGLGLALNEDLEIFKLKITNGDALGVSYDDRHKNSIYVDGNCGRRLRGSWRLAMESKGRGDDPIECRAEEGGRKKRVEQTANGFRP